MLKQLEKLWGSEGWGLAPTSQAQPGTMVVSLERPSNTSDSGKAGWLAVLRSEMAEGGIGWNRVPVS